MIKMLLHIRTWWLNRSNKKALTLNDAQAAEENPDRAAFFAKSISDFGIETLKYLPEVYACLLEFGFVNGSASLLISANGEVKLLLSHGGGSILPKSPQAVQSMAYELLTILNSKRPLFKPESNTAAPEANSSHFFIRTKSGLAKLELGSTSNLTRKSEHYDVYALGQKIITLIRESELA